MLLFIKLYGNVMQLADFHIQILMLTFFTFILHTVLQVLGKYKRIEMDFKREQKRLVDM